MRLLLLLVVVLSNGAPLLAGQPRPSLGGTAESAAEDAAPFTLPVSIERIREALARAPDRSLLDKVPGLDVQPDYRIEIEEWRQMQDIIETLNFRTGPAPAGGLYGYEQQRMLNNPTRNPLGQPYAAFSGNELVTLAVQSLAIRYLGGRALNAVSRAQRERAEQAAREEVTRAIMQYCAAQPDGGASLSICTRTMPPQ